MDYAPAEGTDEFFGGNSNWRGSMWFLVNFSLPFALERYGRIYGETFEVKFPTGSGRHCNLQEVVRKSRSRLMRPFQKDANGRRPVHGLDPLYATYPLWKDLFYEYFGGEDAGAWGSSPDRMDIARGYHTRRQMNTSNCSEESVERTKAQLRSATYPFARLAMT